jgi:hypothetical protein
MKGNIFKKLILFLNKSHIPSIHQIINKFA